MVQIGSLLEEMSNNLGIGEQVTWTGWLHDPWAFLEVADVGLLTSDYEGLPLTVAEFLYHCVPVGAMNCTCNLRDLIASEVNGGLLQPGLRAGIELASPVVKR